jgi:hypothetical protein
LTLRDVVLACSGTDRVFERGGYDWLFRIRDEKVQKMNIRALFPEWEDGAIDIVEWLTADDWSWSKA